MQFSLDGEMSYHVRQSEEFEKKTDSVKATDNCIEENSRHTHFIDLFIYRISTHVAM